MMCGASLPKLLTIMENKNMKKALTIALLSMMSSAVMAEGHYGKLSVGAQNGRDGGQDATEYGITLGKNITKQFSAEVYARIKEKQNGTDGNDTRLEVAGIYTTPLTESLSTYVRAGVGEKFVSGDTIEYWNVEPGLKLKLNDTWAVKGGVRFRDSFATAHQQQDTTYKAGVEYKLSQNTSLGIDAKHKVGDSEYDALGVSYGVKF